MVAGIIQLGFYPAHRRLPRVSRSAGCWWRSGAGVIWQRPTALISISRQWLQKRAPWLSGMPVGQRRPQPRPQCCVGIGCGDRAGHLLSWPIQALQPEANITAIVDGWPNRRRSSGVAQAGLGVQPPGGPLRNDGGPGPGRALLTRLISGTASRRGRRLEGHRLGNLSSQLSRDHGQLESAPITAAAGCWRCGPGGASTRRCAALGRTSRTGRPALKVIVDR